MPLSDSIEQLQTGLVYCTIGQILRRAAFWSIGWGVVILGFGVVISYSRAMDYVNVLVGTALIVEGIYLLVTRNAWAVVVEGSTLAFLTLGNVWGFVSAYRTHAHTAGNPLGTLLLAVGAWNMFSTYRTYKLVCEKADPRWVQFCKEQLDAVTKAKSDTVVFMEVDEVFESTNNCVASFVDDLILFVNGPKKAFRRKVHIESGAWVPRTDVRVENIGDTWIGNRIKARVYVKDAEFLKVKLDRDAFDRLNNLVLGRGAAVVNLG